MQLDRAGFVDFMPEEMKNIIKELPLGSSEFSALRVREQIYVDKTELIFDLASRSGIFFSSAKAFWKVLVAFDI